MAENQLKSIRLEKHIFNPKIICICFLFFLSACSTFQKQLNSDWSKKEIRPDVHLYYRHFSSLFKSPEYINVLDIDLRDTSVKLKIAFNDSLLIKTSDFGKSGKAIAAVNGNFFNTHKGGSVCFLKIDNHLINYTATI